MGATKVMEAIIVHFRGSRRVKRSNQIIVQVDGIDNKEESSKLIGKKVAWVSPSGKRINGELTALHGSKGALRARFEKGLPGQSLGTNICFE